MRVAGADGLDALARDLDAAAEVTPAQVRKVVGKGALNIKNDWRRAWTGLAHAPHLPGAITYDTAVAGTVAEAEIGPDKDRRQGALGNVIEFGTVNNAPIPGGAPALERERPRFDRSLEDVAARPLEAL